MADIKAKRSQFLQKLYKESEQEELKRCNAYKIGEALGFDEKTTDKVIRYFIHEGLIERKPAGRNSPRGTITITHSGICHAEAMFEKHAQSLREIVKEVRTRAKRNNQIFERQISAKKGDSPYIKAGGNISAGGDIIVGKENRKNSTRQDTTLSAKRESEKFWQPNTFKFVVIPLVVALFLGLPSWFLLISKREPHNKTDLTNVYCPISSEIRKEIVINMRRIRNKFRNLDIKISSTSDKGNRLRQRVAEEIAGILVSAGFEAKADSPIIRFSNDTSDVVIKFNENDTELVTDLCKVLNRFFKHTSFSVNKNPNLQSGELQIIIVGDPLFSSDGTVTFQ